MAHPVRRPYVDELVGWLDRKVPISWDNEGPPSPDRQRRWRTGRRAWEMHDPKAEWHIVIQDDALVCRDLLAGLERALDHVPAEGVVQPYIGSKRPAQLTVTKVIRDARDKFPQASWVGMRSMGWGVAIAAKVETIADMIDWCNSRVTMPYDMRIGRFYRDALRQLTWHPFPSLVDHRQGPSLIAHSDAGRHAHVFWEGSALDLDWNGRVVVEPKLERFFVAQPRAISPRYDLGTLATVEAAQPELRNPRSLKRRPGDPLHRNRRARIDV
jgi:hypothetical protein